MTPFNRYGISGISGLPIAQAVPYNIVDAQNFNTYRIGVPSYDGEYIFANTNLNIQFVSVSNKPVFNLTNGSYLSSNAAFSGFVEGQLLINLINPPIGSNNFQSVQYQSRIKSNGNLQLITQQYGLVYSSDPLPNGEMQSFFGIYQELNPNNEFVEVFVFSDIVEPTKYPNPPQIFGQNFVSGYCIDDDGFNFMFAQNTNSTPEPVPYNYRYNFSDTSNVQGLYQATPYNCRTLGLAETVIGNPPGCSNYGGINFASASIQRKIWKPYRDYSRAPSSIVSANAYLPTNAGNMGEPPYAMPYIQGLNCFLVQIFPANQFGTPIGEWFDMQANQFVPIGLNNELNSLSSLIDSLVNGVSNLKHGPSFGLHGDILKINVTRYNSGYVLCVTPSQPLTGLNGSSPAILSNQGTPLVYYSPNGGASKQLPAPYNEPYFAVYDYKTQAKFTPRLIPYPEGYSGNAVINQSIYPNNPISMWLSPTSGSIYCLYYPNDGSTNILVTTLGFLYVEPAITYNFNWRD